MGEFVDGWKYGLQAARKMASHYKDFANGKDWHEIRNLPEVKKNKPMRKLIDEAFRCGQACVANSVLNSLDFLDFTKNEEPNP